MELPVTALLPLLLLPLAATLAASRYTYRTCNCVVRDNRANKSQQVCVLDQEHGELSSCSQEMVPRISVRYYYAEPQGLFSPFRINMRYHQARIFCEQEGGRLAVPQNAHVYKRLKEIVYDVTRSNVWLGLNDRETEGTWMTVDGTRPPALAWASGAPNNKNDKDCGELKYPDAALNDNHCWLEQHFMCERRLRKPIPPGYKWSQYCQMFYKHYREEKTYPEARRQCEQDGGSLVSISTIEEARFVLLQLPALWNTPFVDFTDEAVEGEFVDSRGRRMESTDFYRWKDGQPDNGGKRGPENCVLLVGTGIYVDVPCLDMHPFVCQLNPL